MTQPPPPIPYASTVPVQSEDQGQLKAIIICHYVWAGMAMLFSCFFIIYIVMGVLMLHGKFGAGNGANATPPQVGWIFIGMGCGLVTLGWTLGILTLISARGMSHRKWRTFSLVVAGANCISIPLGTLLGIFTFIVLLRPSVRAQYSPEGPERLRAIHPVFTRTIVAWLIIVAALAVVSLVMRWFENRSAHFAEWIKASIGETDDLPHLSQSRSVDWLWWVVGAGFLIAAFAFLEFRQHYYFTQDDALVAELPGMIEGCRSVWAGVWPDYDPCRLMGGPLAPAGVFSLTYPPTYLSYAIARHVLHDENALLEVFAALHLAAGYGVMMWLCRSMGIRPLLGCCATLSFLLSGSILIMGRSWHTFLPLVVWMPLLMACVERLIKGPLDWKYTLGAGLALGLLFHVGFPQLWFYAALLMACALILLWVTGNISLGRLGSAWPCAVIAMGVVLPLLIPQLGAARGVDRPAPLGTGITVEWVAALIPYPLKVRHPMGWGSTEVRFMGHFIYFGSVFAVLFILSVVAVLSRTSRRVWSRNIWLALAIIALLITLGDRGPFYFVFAKLPFVQSINNDPFRALPFFVLFAVIGSAKVAERMLRTTAIDRWWARAFAVLTIMLLSYHVLMAKPSFYTYGFKPFPKPASSSFKKLVSLPPERMISWTTRESVSPLFPMTLPMDMPMLYGIPAFSGYDPLLEWSPSFKKAEELLTAQPVESLRAYGVRWQLISPLLHKPVFSANPEIQPREKSIKNNSALKAVMPLLQIVAHWDDVRLGELSDVSPLAFSQQQPALPLPLIARGDGIRVDLKQAPAPGKVVVNFLWNSQMRATVDGKAAILSPDAWQRMVVEIPANASFLQIRYVAGWTRGLFIGAGLILLGLAGRWMQTRRADA